MLFLDHQTSRWDYELHNPTYQTCPYSKDNFLFQTDRLKRQLYPSSTIYKLS